MSVEDTKHPQRPAALQAALRFVIASEMPSEHKATLIEVLTQAIRDEGAAELRREAAARSRGEWQEPEIVHLKSFLQGRAATSWQHADECLMQLATQLHRDPVSVRHKATELGLGIAVDYRFARQLIQSREQ
jgi:sarcosine oxidase delta subunit